MSVQLKFILSVLLISFCLAAETSETFKDVVIQSVDRQIDATSQLVKVETTLEIKNERAGNLEEVYLAVPSEHAQSLRFLVVKGTGYNSKPLEYSVVDNLRIKNDHQATLYKIHLETPIRSGQTQKLQVSEVHWGRMNPLPKFVATQDDQKMILEDNVYLFSPYTVLSQTSYYRLPSMPISFSNQDGTQRGQAIEYRQSSTVAPFERKSTKIHFINNTPFVVFKEVEKVIEVSHWGNIYVQETYKIANEGATFKGEFSRIDYSTYNTNTGKSALRGLQASYPVHAWGMHYRDEVGNISTSKAYRDSSNVRLQITPRFAIFGGWSHNWVISYNLPTNYYLFSKENDPTSFVLKQNFGYPFENIMAEKYTVKVLLPEGALNARAELPFTVDSQTQEQTYSYLDISGRPTLVLQKDNMLDYYNKELIVQYNFESSNLFLEPAMLFGIFLALFAILIVLGRVSLTPEKSDKKVKTE